MASQADIRRYQTLQRMGCIVARLYFGAYLDADVHHITAGGRRLGNQYTIPLSPWSHRGLCNDGRSPEDMASIYGPSLALNKREFVARFGTEIDLLSKVNAEIAAMAKSLVAHGIASA